MRHLPEDIRAEVLLDCLPEGSFAVRLRGLHKRNACKDLLEWESCSGGRQVLELARMSLYNSLPEYFFHTFDRFDQMDGHETRERFLEEVERQEQEKENATAFFNPIDLALLAKKRTVYEAMLPYVYENKVLQDILSDRLSQEQRENRFIKKTIPFLQYAKYIRGNRTLFSFFLRKIFKEENLELTPMEDKRIEEDSNPRYQDSVGGQLNELFVGNRYDVSILCYCVQYWPTDECDGQFLHFVQDVELFRLFLRDWFLSVEEDILFTIEDRLSSIRLSDTSSYLNYNTNL